MQATATPDVPRDEAAYIAVAHPVERARLLTVAAGQFRAARKRFPPKLARLRRAALREAREDGRKVVHIAARVGLSPARISQLTEPEGAAS